MINLTDKQIMELKEARDVFKYGRYPWIKDLWALVIGAPIIIGLFYLWARLGIRISGLIIEGLVK